MEDPIKAIWDQYKHLDGLLSDKTWIDGDDPSPMRQCLFDCWQAIKKSQEA